MSKLKRHKKYHPPFNDSFPNEDQDTCKSKQKISNSTFKISNQPIFQRAIASAQKHGIKLEAGRENRGNGNCSYESVIYNINGRDCFKEKLPMSSDYYRRIWNTDMMNKLLEKRIPWNPGLTRAELTEGFKELMETGVYERPYFGDMMMAGIACGVRKRILIFNTNENITTTGHDPVSVIDPTEYGGWVDSEVPVVVAYDLVHFESLHPVGREDIAETEKLVRSYTAKPSRYVIDYGFTRKDIRHLITKAALNLPEDKSKINSHQENQVEIKGTEHQIKVVDQIERKRLKIKEKELESERMDLNKEEKGSSQKHQMFKYEGISFQELETGKIVCGICQVECQRLICHLNKSAECNKSFNMENFKVEYVKYKARLRKNKQENKQKKENPERFKDDTNKRKAQHEARKKTEDLSKFKEDANKRKAQHEARKKAEDLKKFKEDAKKRLAEHEAKKKAEDLSKFKEDANKRKAQHEARKKTEDLKKFNDNAKKRLAQHEAKRKAEDLKKFNDEAKKRKAKHEAKKKVENYEKFKEATRERRAKSDMNITAKRRVQKFKKKGTIRPYICLLLLSPEIVSKSGRRANRQTKRGYRQGPSRYQGKVHRR